MREMIGEGKGEGIGEESKKKKKKKEISKTTCPHTQSFPFQIDQHRPIQSK